jgi:TetR/AcrR family transcriptional regulator
MPLINKYNMKGKEHITESKILDAAKEVFMHKGFDGARMQEIADAAGINKALLHYYFRSKEKLFDAAFRQAASQLFPSALQILEEDQPFTDKIVRFINTYIDILIANPLLPAFVLHEINNNPSKLAEIVKNSGVDPGRINHQVQAEINAGRIRADKPEHIMVNLLSMCIFPFTAQVVIKEMLRMSDPEFNLFMEARKSEIVNFFMQSIKVI